MIKIYKEIGQENAGCIRIFTETKEDCNFLKATCLMLGVYGVKNDCLAEIFNIPSVLNPITEKRKERSYIVTEIFFEPITVPEIISIFRNK